MVFIITIFQDLCCLCACLLLTSLLAQQLVTNQQLQLDGASLRLDPQVTELSM